MKGYLVIFFVLLNIGLVSAATISGNVYDLNLNKTKNVVLTISTTPKQTFVSKDGHYAFNVPKGVYMIEAVYNSLIANESIKITDNGNYTLDLILYPNIEQEESDLMDNITEENVPFETDVTWPYTVLTIMAIVILMVILNFSFRQRNNSLNHEEGNDLDKVLAFIKKEGGRTTQKDIRKEFPLSEAKISLMITELEHKGLVERIKKGRANVVILKKD